MSKKDVARIKRVQSEFVKACNVDDIDAWQKTLGNDVVLMPPDAPRVSGKKAAAVWAKGAFFDPFRMKLRIKFDRVQVMGSQAFAPGSFSIDLTPKAGGNATKGIGKFIHGFKKQKDGSWKFSNLIFNYDKPPA